MQRFIGLIAFTCLLSVLLMKPGLEAKPNLIDTDKLNFKIKDVQVVDKIVIYQNSISAQEDNQLVVITLEGNAPFECIHRISDADFSAVFETNEIRAIRGAEFNRCEVARASAIEINGIWGIPEKNDHIELEFSLNPGTVYFKIAFLLPKEIDSFYINYPKIIKDKATILRNK